MQNENQEELARTLGIGGAGAAELASALTGARCLVTGGAGFIGSNLTRALLAAGARVTALDSFDTGKRENLPESDALSVIEDDVSSVDRLGRLVAEADYVFHLAAQVGNMRSIAETEGDARTNIIGSVRLFDACREAGVRKIVYSSSSAIFGEAERVPIDEGHGQRPASFYALSKLTAERYALLATGLLGVPIVNLRYFNVYGSPMEANEYAGVISIFFERLAAGDELTIYGDGEQYRDFVHVLDVVQANLLAAVRGEPGGVYNIGSGVRTTLNELAALASEVAGRPIRVVHEGFRAGEVRASLADIAKAKRELGYLPVWTLQRGLAELWQKLEPAAAE